MSHSSQQSSMVWSQWAIHIKGMYIFLSLLSRTLGENKCKRTLIVHVAVLKLNPCFDKKKKKKSFVSKPLRAKALKSWFVNMVAFLFYFYSFIPMLCVLSCEEVFVNARRKVKVILQIFSIDVICHGAEA